MSTLLLDSFHIPPNIHQIYLSLFYQASAEQKTDKQASSTSAASTSAGSAPSMSDKDWFGQPLTKQDLESLKSALLDDCMKMLDSMPCTVFKICQLLVVIAEADEKLWKEHMFKQLLSQVSSFYSFCSYNSYSCHWTVLCFYIQFKDIRSTM